MSQYRLWVLVVIVVVQGCATPSPDPCRTHDWYAIGYQDGLAGRASGPAAGPERSCPAGVAERQLAQYRVGRDAGLTEYCEPQNGFRLGLGGEDYHGACRAAVEAGFLRAYHQGKQMHDVETQIRRLDTILAVNESERDSLGERVGRKQTELGQRRLGTGGHATLRAELRELEDTVAMVEAEIDAIEAALREEHAQLTLLRQGSHSWEQQSR